MLSYFFDLIIVLFINILTFQKLTLIPSSGIRNICLKYLVTVTDLCLKDAASVV
jgi:hypothetical protein